MSRPAAVGLALVVSASFLAGCTHPSTAPTPPVTAAGPTTTPAPVVETTPPPDPVQVNIDAAIAAYRNYVAVRDAVRQDHYRDWETKVLPLTNADEADWVASFFSQAAALGHYQIGGSVVSNVALTANGYSEDPTGAGHERVVFEVCLDSTNNHEFGADGQETSVPGSLGRFIATVTMQHETQLDGQGTVMEDPCGQAWWRVDSEDYDRERPC